MPRRPLVRGLESTSATPHAQSPALPSSATLSPELLELRRHWKWAAFSQFFFTFAPLFNMSDVTIADIEDDLTRSTGITLPRIMQRLLYTVSYDRKTNLDNWQTVLRKQYYKRDPAANPIGPEPSYDSEQEISPEHETPVTRASEEPRGSEGDQEIPATDLDDDGVKHEGRITADAVERQTASPLPLPEHQEPQSPRASNNEGTPIIEESKNWLDLTMLEKLDSMHLVTEWQFHNPLRVRTLMKDDDEDASWRIEPIGYDAKSNAYWLIGADRLWIQRSPPKPSHQKKRKRAASGGANIPQAKRADHGRKQTGQSSAAQPSASRGNGRAAKAQAKIKLDAQAKELANFQREAAASARSKGRTPLPPPRGTRLSKRLRGPIEEDGWQPVPDEWLENESSPSRAQSQRVVPKTGLESDDESALTSLSDDEEPELQTVQVEDAGQVKADDSDNLDERGIEIPAETPNGFVEWETIAVTLHEWENVAEPFAKATHYTEKALYKVLTVDIAPVIVAEMREILRQRQLEESIVHRKRSSRIAIKESEKEEAQVAAQRKAEEVEKLSRAQRLEARQQREEAERIKRETAREQRKKEREQREARNSKAADQSDDDIVDVVGDIPLKPTYSNGSSAHTPHQANLAGNGSLGGARTPDWELDCEVCLRRGVNQDDGQPMMSCGTCNKWQHINCHDNADYAAGRRRRNWTNEEFVCHRCQSRTFRAAGPVQHLTKPQAIGQPLPPGQMPYAQSSAPGRGYAVGTSHPPPHATGQNGQHMYGGSVAPATVLHQRAVQPQPAITFAHYQPDPQGFSNRQTYQRDQQMPPRVYSQHQPYAASVPHQPHPMQAPIHQAQPPQYGHGTWPQQSHGHVTYNNGYTGQQTSNPPEWHNPTTPTDPRTYPVNYYSQYPPNPIVDSAPYTMPR